MNKRTILPPSVREALTARGVPEETLHVAVADMSPEGELRSVYLLLTDAELILAASDQSGEAAYAGATPVRHKNEGVQELHRYPLSSLSDPEIQNQVVGGLLCVRVDGDETWLCRFSGFHMRDMRQFCRHLEALLKGEEYVPDEEEDAGFCPKCGAPYPEKGRAVCPHCMKRHTVFRRLLGYFAGFKGRIAIVLFCVTLSGVSNAVLPYLTGSVLYDRVLGRDEAFAASLGMGEQFALVLLSVVLCAFLVKIVQQIAGVIHGRTTGHIVPGVVYKIKTSVFEALGRLSIGFFTRRQTGSLMNRVNGDANEVMFFFIDGLPYLIFNIATFVFAGVVMFITDWKLAILSVLMLPPLFIISTKLVPYYWHAHGRRSRSVRAVYSTLNDNLTGARVVKAFGQEHSENDRFAKVNGRLRDAEMQLAKYDVGFDAAYALGRELPKLLVWSVGAWLVLQTKGEFSYGALMTFVNYLVMMQGPMEFLSYVFRWWSQSMNCAQRIFEIIDAVPEITEAERPVDRTLKGDVRLSHVGFSYDPNKPVLKDISFEIKAGEMLGIVGKSGAGKSTLVNLISRLYDPQEGAVYLDGINVKDLSFASLRGAVAMVSQETYIFMGTVADNIAYARPNATREEIVRAAVAASAHAFICKLPDGYDTVIGAGGRDLSGGERQRLSIARAILADPQILVLDEATASVDTETERHIQTSLERLIKGRTTISIAHRLSTLRNADKLIVLEDGKLVESGTHEELVRRQGEYFKLLQLQSKALAMRGVE